VSHDPSEINYKNDYADLALKKKHSLLISMLKSVVLLSIFMGTIHILGGFFDE